MFKDSRSLEISCYVLCAGAFSIFARWMQLQLAYNDDDLPDSSVWNVLVPLLILAGAFIFYRFLKKSKEAGFTLSGDLFEALRNNGTAYTVVRWIIGAALIAGSALLFLESSTDRNVVFLRVLSVLGMLTGLCFPLLLSCANRPHAVKQSTTTLLSLIPILFFSVWLLTSYKRNSINPVRWDFVIEILALIVCMEASFRIAGFAYGVPSTRKSMFFSMLSAMLCMMCIADERMLGESVMFGASALMFVMLNWVMVSNFKKEEKPIIPAVEVVVDDGGLERLK